MEAKDNDSATECVTLQFEKMRKMRKDDKVYDLDPYAPLLPATSGSVGLDLRSPTDCIVPPWGRQKIELGLRLLLPPNYFAYIAPRSGLAVHNGVVAFMGTIDTDFRGPLSVILFSYSNEPYFIERGEKIAQLILAKAVPVKLQGCSEIKTDTDRAEGGFGSSGKF